jgi:hypothetical protein
MGHTQRVSLLIFTAARLIASPANARSSSIDGIRRVVSTEDEKTTVVEINERRDH